MSHRIDQSQGSKLSRTTDRPQTDRQVDSLTEPCSVKIASKIPVLRSLNLCLKTPMQNELGQTDQPALRKCPKCGWILQIWITGKISKFSARFGIFSKTGGWIELIPFALSQAS